MFVEPIEGENDGFFFVVLEFYDLNSAKNVFMEHFFECLTFDFAEIVELISVHVFYVFQNLIEVVIGVQTLLFRDSDEFVFVRGIKLPVVCHLRFG
jgi:hypothetical protein